MSKAKIQADETMAVRNFVVERPKCLRPVKERGLFTVRAQWQQIGVRVGRSGHINVRSQSSKNLRDLEQLQRFSIQMLACEVK